MSMEEHDRIVKWMGVFELVHELHVLCETMLQLRVHCAAEVERSRQSLALYITCADQASTSCHCQDHRTGWLHPITVQVFLYRPFSPLYPLFKSHDRLMSRCTLSQSKCPLTMTSLTSIPCQNHTD